jgi:hypothetical protein
MSLYKDITALLLNYPASNLIVGLGVELSREQFKDFIKEYKESIKDWTVINWEEFDITKPVKMKTATGAELIIKIKE